MNLTGISSSQNNDSTNNPKSNLCNNPSTRRKTTETKPEVKPLNTRNVALVSNEDKKQLVKIFKQWKNNDYNYNLNKSGEFIIHLNKDSTLSLSLSNPQNITTLCLLFNNYMKDKKFPSKLKENSEAIHIIKNSLNKNPIAQILYNKFIALINTQLTSEVDKALRTLDKAFESSSVIKVLQFLNLFISCHAHNDSIISLKTLDDITTKVIEIIPHPDVEIQKKAFSVLLSLAKYQLLPKEALMNAIKASVLALENNDNQKERLLNNLETCNTESSEKAWEDFHIANINVHKLVIELFITLFEEKYLEHNITHQNTIIWLINLTLPLLNSENKNLLSNIFQLYGLIAENRLFILKLEKLQPIIDCIESNLHSDLINSDSLNINILKFLSEFVDKQVLNAKEESFKIYINRIKKAVITTYRRAGQTLLPYVTELIQNLYKYDYLSNHDTKLNEHILTQIEFNLNPKKNDQILIKTLQLLRELIKRGLQISKSAIDSTFALAKEDSTASEALKVLTTMDKAEHINLDAQFIKEIIAWPNVTKNRELVPSINSLIIHFLEKRTLPKKAINSLIFYFNKITESYDDLELNAQIISILTKIENQLPTISNDNANTLFKTLDSMLKNATGSSELKDQIINFIKSQLSLAQKKGVKFPEHTSSLLFNEYLKEFSKTELSNKHKHLNLLKSIAKTIPAETLVSDNFKNFLQELFGALKEPNVSKELQNKSLDFILSLIETPSTDSSELINQLINCPKNTRNSVVAKLCLLLKKSPSEVLEKQIISSLTSLVGKIKDTPAITMIKQIALQAIGNKSDTEILKLYLNLLKKLVEEAQFKKDTKDTVSLVRRAIAIVGSDKKSDDVRSLTILILGRIANPQHLSKVNRTLITSTYKALYNILVSNNAVEHLKSKIIESFSELSKSGLRITFDNKITDAIVNLIISTSNDDTVANALELLSLVYLQNKTLLEPFKAKLLIKIKGILHHGNDRMKSCALALLPHLMINAYSSKKEIIIYKEAILAFFKEESNPFQVGPMRVFAMLAEKNSFNSSEAQQALPLLINGLPTADRYYSRLISQIITDFIKHTKISSDDVLKTMQIIINKANMDDEMKLKEAYVNLFLTALQKEKFLSANQVQQFIDKILKKIEEKKNDELIMAEEVLGTILVENALQLDESKQYISNNILEFLKNSTELKYITLALKTVLSLIKHKYIDAAQIKDAMEQVFLCFTVANNIKVKITATETFKIIAESCPEHLPQGAKLQPVIDFAIKLIQINHQGLQVAAANLLTIFIEKKFINKNENLKKIGLTTVLRLMVPENKDKDELLNVCANICSNLLDQNHLSFLPEDNIMLIQSLLSITQECKESAVEATRLLGALFKHKKIPSNQHDRIFNTTLDLIQRNNEIAQNCNISLVFFILSEQKGFDQVKINALINIAKRNLNSNEATLSNGAFGLLITLMIKQKLDENNVDYFIIKSSQVFTNVQSQNKEHYYKLLLGIKKYKLCNRTQEKVINNLTSSYENALTNVLINSSHSL